jgi:hypothetical protein
VSAWKICSVPVATWMGNKDKQGRRLWPSILEYWTEDAIGYRYVGHKVWVALTTNCVRQKDRLVWASALSPNRNIVPFHYTIITITSIVFTSFYNKAVYILKQLSVGDLPCKDLAYLFWNKAITPCSGFVSILPRDGSKVSACTASLLYLTTIVCHFPPLLSRAHGRSDG